MHSAEELAFDQLDRLQKAMRVSGQSAVSLAAALGVHRNTIGNYLSGRTPVDRRTLIAWAMACGVPLEWLETGQAPTNGPGPGTELPRLDSNQQPFGSVFSQVRRLITPPLGAVPLAA